MQDKDDSKDWVEREQVEQVFGLGGGELNDSPTLGYAYGYDGVPEWAGEDFDDERAGEDFDDEHDRDYATVIVFGGGFLPYPEETITEPDGTVWELIRSYANGGEATCPLTDCDEEWPEDFAKAGSCPLCEANLVRHGGCLAHGDAPVTPDDVPGWDRMSMADKEKATVKCPYCGDLPVSQHGCIYIGEGYEAVYRRRTMTLEEIEFAYEDRIGEVIDVIERKTAPPEEASRWRRGGQLDVYSDVSGRDTRVRIFVESSPADRTVRFACELLERSGLDVEDSDELLMDFMSDFASVDEPERIEAAWESFAAALDVDRIVRRIRSYEMEGE